MIGWQQYSDLWVFLSIHVLMMTSSNGNIFHVTGHLCGEFTGLRWIPPQRPVTRSFDVFFDLRLNKRCVWVNNREAGDLRRYRAHYDVTVMTFPQIGDQFQSPREGVSMDLFFWRIIPSVFGIHQCAAYRPALLHRTYRKRCPQVCDL